jgi:2-polyprenyl-3-methyl-5-hydroxy-6-metoxy-1,4-benzoquinol methylase
MTATKADELRALAADRPATLALIENVLEIWPEHAAYLLKSFTPRTPAMMDAAEAAAVATGKLIAADPMKFAADYRWTCDQLRDEELFFHREGRYRLSTFAAAHAEVYSNHDYMGRYVNGLLLTQVLWFNHVATFEMFLNKVLSGSPAPFEYLEVGPGHGLMIYFAAQSPQCRTLEAWDVSSVSLRETRAALDTLGLTKPVALAETDILQTQRPGKAFDLIVISEVLEHLETPGVALRFLRDCVTDGGRIFISVPLNSPSPDHIYLFEAPDDVRALVEGAGFHIETLSLFATQGRSIESALSNRISVSAGIIARLHP